MSETDDNPRGKRFLVATVGTLTFVGLAGYFLYTLLSPPAPPIESARIAFDLFIASAVPGYEPPAQQWNTDILWWIIELLYVSLFTILSYRIGRRGISRL